MYPHCFGFKWAKMKVELTVQQSFSVGVLNFGPQLLNIRHCWRKLRIVTCTQVRVVEGPLGAFFSFILFESGKMGLKIMPISSLCDL